MGKSLQERLSDLSNYSHRITGSSNELDNYTGYGDSSVDFGKNGGSFFNMNDGQPFQLRFQNTHASRSFYVWLSCGLDYRAGTVAGQIDPDGTFAGENAGDGTDPGTSISVSAPISTQSLYKYARWIQDKTSIISKLEITPDDATTFLASNMIVQREDVVNQSPAKPIPMRKYASDKSFNLQFIDIFEKLIFSDQYIIKILLPPDSYTNVNVYFGATISDTAQMEKKVDAAVRTGITNGTLKQAIQAAGKMEEILR